MYILAGELTQYNPVQFKYSKEHQIVFTWVSGPRRLGESGPLVEISTYEGLTYWPSLWSVSEVFR